MKNRPKARIDVVSAVSKRDRLLLATASLVVVTAIALLVNSVVFETPSRTGAVIPVPHQNPGAAPIHSPK